MNEEMTFDIKLRGYDRKAVKRYIEALTQEYNEMYQAYHTLEQSYQLALESLCTLRENTDTIAQVLIDARVQAKAIVADAYAKACVTPPREDDQGHGASGGRPVPQAVGDGDDAGNLAAGETGAVEGERVAVLPDLAALSPEELCAWLDGGDGL